MRTLVWLSFIASVTVFTVHCAQQPRGDENLRFGWEGQQRRSHLGEMRKHFFNDGRASQIVRQLWKDGRVKVRNQNGGLASEQVAALEAELKELSDGSENVIRKIGDVREWYSQQDSCRGMSEKVHAIFEEEDAVRRLVPQAVVVPNEKKARPE